MLARTTHHRIVARRLPSWLLLASSGCASIQILLRHGGVYVDTDFLCLDSFEDLHRRYDFYTGVSNTGTFELNNGLVG